jgi:hypothetical protein
MRLTTQRYDEIIARHDALAATVKIQSLDLQTYERQRQLDGELLKEQSETVRSLQSQVAALEAAVQRFRQLLHLASNVELQRDLSGFRVIKMMTEDCTTCQTTSLLEIDEHMGEEDSLESWINYDEDTLFG